MSDQLTLTEQPPVLLVGAGRMATAYADVLAHLGRTAIVFGRGSASAATFEAATGLSPSTGPLEVQIARTASLPEQAIVTVNAMSLTEVTVALARAGVRRILVEKPAALDTGEMAALQAVSAEASSDIRIGYNRRYLASVRRAREMITEDGGVVSVKFDFSEPARRIAKLDKPGRELVTWFYGNSLHVVDLAFHLAGGTASVVSGTTAGEVSWHPAAGVFVGHATATSGALLSWHANWVGPGRWGVEVITAERRIILQPLERLRVQDHDSFEEHHVELDLGDDTMFKPGLLRQVVAFLDGDDDENLADVAEQARRWPVYEAIRTGGTIPRQSGEVSA